MFNREFESAPEAAAYGCTMVFFFLVFLFAWSIFAALFYLVSRESFEFWRGFLGL